jgi:hypothetical protein
VSVEFVKLRFILRKAESGCDVGPIFLSPQALPSGGSSGRPWPTPPSEKIPFLFLFFFYVRAVYGIRHQALVSTAIHVESIKDFDLRCEWITY